METKRSQGNFIIIDNTLFVNDNNTMNIENIIALRIRIKDPHGFPMIVSATEMPASPDELTAYRLGDNLYYDSENNRLDMNISDNALDAMITAHGIDASECRAYAEIAKTLGGQMRIARLTTGTETTQWTSLVELYNFYRQLSIDCKAQISSDTGSNTGRIGRSKQPTICGGWL